MRWDSRIKPSRMWLDRAGITASSLCAVHCIVTALVLAFVPAWTRLADERVEWVLWAAALAIGLASLLPGFFRGHRDLRPPALLAAGFAVLVARFAMPEGGAAEIACAVTGALFLVAAHVVNLRLSVARCCAPARGA